MKGRAVRTHWAGMTQIVRISLALLVCSLTIGVAWGQLRNSTITGTVTDPTGAVVPKAMITITNQLTNEAVKTQSGPTGEYAVPYLAPGKYAVAVDAPGFRTYRVSNIAIDLGVTVQQNVRLTVGAASQVVQVTGTTAELQTETSSVTGTVGTQQIANLPNINDDPLYYATLSAGVVPAPGMYNDENLGVGFENRIGYSEIRVNGGAIGMDDVQLDGVPVQDSGWHSVAVMPNRDALQEVTVAANDLSADLGGGQAVIEMVTKSGTNQFHGDAFYNLRNEQLNANGLANDMKDIPRGKYRVDEAGGSVGGPVILPKIFNGKNKVFFFASFDRLWNVTPASFLNAIPTALEAVGDFSSSFVQSGSTAVPVQLYDPYNVTALGSGLFARTQIDSAKVKDGVEGADSYGLKYLGAWEQVTGGPNRTAADPYGSDNYFHQGTAPLKRNNLDARMDIHFGKNSFYVSGGIQNGTASGVNEWGPTSPWQNLSQAIVQDDDPYYAVGDIITLNPSTFIDLHVGYQRIGSASSFATNGGWSNGSSTSGNTYTAWGMPAALQPLIVIPTVAPSVYNLGYEPGNYGYSLNNTQWNWKNEHQNNYDFNGSITKVIGRWTLKEGADQRIDQGNWRDIEWMTPSLGAYSDECYCEQYYNTDGSSNGAYNSNPVQNGTDRAQGSMGIMGYRDDPGSGLIPALSFKWFAIYTQNDWKATNRLTINLGLRYEIQPGPTERHNQLYSVDLYKENPYASGLSVSTPYGGYPSPQAALGYFAFPGTDGYSRNEWNMELGDVAPRLGAAFRLNDKTVIRGGYGRIYAPSNSGYNANGTVYGAGAWSGGSEFTPYGISTNGYPGGVYDQLEPGNPSQGRFEDIADTTLLPAPFQGTYKAGQSPLIYGSANANAGADNFIRTMKNTYVDQWNVFVERRFGSWLASAGYVGSRGGAIPWRLWPLSGTFQVPQTTLQAWRSVWYATSASVDESTEQVPNPMPALQNYAAGPIGQGTISALQSQEGYLGLLTQTVINDTGSSLYHSMQLSLNHSFSSGLTAQFSYTFSHATGISEGADYATYAESQAVSGNTNSNGGFNYSNLQGNYGLLGYDVPHRFIGVVTYQSQWGSGGKWELGNPVSRALAGGWTLGTVVNLQTGEPFGVSCNSGQASVGPIDGKCIETGQNLQVPKSMQGWYKSLTNVTLPDGHQIQVGPYQYLKFNPDAFANQVVQFPNGKYGQDQFYYGNTPTYDTNLREPGIQNANFNITRDFNITERYKFQLLGEFTNFLNHQNLLPGAVSNGVGSLVSVSSLPVGGAIGENSSVTGAMSPSFMDPRQVTLTLKFTF